MACLLSFWPGGVPIITLVYMTTWQLQRSHMLAQIVFDTEKNNNRFCTYGRKTFILLSSCYHVCMHDANKMSHRIRKPTICICQNKGANQLCSNCTAHQCLCFRFVDSSNLNQKFQASSYFLWLYRPMCVRLGRKPWRPVFSMMQIKCMLMCFWSMTQHFLSCCTNGIWK